MSSPFTQARASVMSATAVFAVIAALASCGWDTPESALHDAGANAHPAARALLASGSAGVAAHRFSDDYAVALRLLATQAPEPTTPTF